MENTLLITTIIFLLTTIIFLILFFNKHKKNSLLIQNINALSKYKGIVEIEKEIETKRNEFNNIKSEIEKANKNNDIISEQFKKKYQTERETFEDY